MMNNILWSDRDKWSIRVNLDSVDQIRLETLGEDIHVYIQDLDQEFNFKIATDDIKLYDGEDNQLLFGEEERRLLLHCNGEYRLLHTLNDGILVMLPRLNTNAKLWFWFGTRQDAHEIQENIIKQNIKLLLF